MKDRLLNAVKALHAGAVLAHATETCYGLAVDIFQKGAVEKLYRLKQMPFSKPVSILVRDLQEAQRYGEFSAAALKLAQQHWPGPLTLIVPRTAALPLWINPGLDSVGIRVSDHKEVQALLEAFGGPLTTTSANVSGEPQAYAASDMGLKPDLILDSGSIPKNPPSTIVKVDGAELRVIRQGARSLPFPGPEASLQ